MDMTIAASLAASLIDFAESMGAERSDLLTAASLNANDVSDPDGRISADAYGELQTAAIAATGDTGLPMRHAASQRLEHLSIVGLIVESAGSLPEVIKQLNRYVELIADIPLANRKHRFELVREGSATWLVDHLPLELAGSAAIEETFVSFATSYRHSEPNVPLALEVMVVFKRPAHGDLYGEVFQAPTTFQASRNALRIHPHWLKTNSLNAKPYALNVFTNHGDALLALLREATTFRARVEEQILKELHKGPVPRESVARDLAVSERTLHRRLKDEGYTYAEVYDGVRDKLAREYLTVKKVTVAEVAFLLGFSETSAFVRAFRRWTGLSPSDFRQTLI